MKRSILTAFLILTLIGQAWAGFSLLRFGGRDQNGIVVNNDRECYATSSILDTGSQVANTHRGVSLKDESGEWVGAGQVMTGNTNTKDTDLSSVVEALRQKNSEYLKGDGTQTGGDKRKSGPVANTAVTGQGVSNATVEPPEPPGETVTVNKAELDELLAEIARLKAEAEPTD